MPTETRQALVLSRVKGDFRANAAEKDPQEVEGMIQLAELQVDNLEVSWGGFAFPYLLISIDGEGEKLARF